MSWASATPAGAPNADTAKAAAKVSLASFIVISSFRPLPEWILGTGHERTVTVKAPGGSDPGVPLIAAGVLPIAALAPIEPCQPVAQLDPHHVFGLLVAELAFDPEPHGRAVAERERRAVHPPGEDRLGVK